MKFRDLKHRTWISWFDCFHTNSETYYNVHILGFDGLLYATFEWEYDNGLYVETGNESFNMTWKSIKQNMSYIKWNGKKEKQYVQLYKGKCSKCGSKIFKQEFYNNEGNICTKCLKDWCLDEE